MAEIVTLSCPTCGGKLTIKPGINRFACGYCGNEHIVHREGGIVSLEVVGESLQRIEVSSDRTALELTLSRLEKEINQLKSQEQGAIQTVESLSNQIKYESRGYTLDCGELVISAIIGLVIASLIIGNQRPNFAVAFGLFIALTVGAVVALEAIARDNRMNRITNTLKPKLEAAQNILSEIQLMLQKKAAEQASTLEKIYGELPASTDTNNRNSDYQCADCGASVSSSDTTCPKCGANLNEYYCEKCGVTVSASDMLCPNCGDSLE